MHSIKKHQLRVLIKEAMNIQVPEDAVRRAIELYDPEISYTEQPEEVLHEVEQILGIKGFQWPTPYYRRMMISRKMRVSLKAVLKSYGRVFLFTSMLLKLANVSYRYTMFSYYGENQKPRLEISPNPGREPPPLPKWLQIPYLVPVKGQSLQIVYDSCLNPTIRSGDGLYDRAERIVGTLSAVMSSSRAGQADAYVIPTAGHVIPNGDDSLLVENRQLGSFTSLKVAAKFRRFDSRPLFRLNEAPSFLDDIGILFVDNNDLKYFSRRIANLNVHYFDPEGRTSSASEMADPVSMPRRDALQKLLEVSPIIVYKVGVMTDLTMGRFVRIRDVPPAGWYEPEDGEEVEEVEEMDKEDEEWLGVVQWMDVPFAAPGDSGSLVFAREEGIIIPLGIHVGSPTSMPNTSIFISLETFCFEAEAEGLEPHFCH
jgi:hypothetical protein